MEESGDVVGHDVHLATPAEANATVSESAHAALRVGVAGAGFIGAVHARSARLAGATLAGVATSTPERSREAAARLGAEEAYATPEQLATADDVDVLHICTPNHLHAELAALALAHGKHVVCEKPLAVSTAQAAELIEAARAAGPGRDRAVRLPLPPGRPRGARPRPRRRARPGPPDPRRLPAGLARLGRRRQLADRRRPRRPVARLRRHRLALVRPRRVHHRRPDHRALRPDRDRLPGARRRMRTRRRSPPRGPRTASAARSRPRTRSPRCSARSPAPRAR